MREQIERLLRELGLVSLTLGILPSTARVDLFPVNAFNIYGDGERAHVELVSSSMDITEQSEFDLYDKAFTALSSAASYGNAAEELLRKSPRLLGQRPVPGVDALLDRQRSTLSLNGDGGWARFYARPSRS